MLLWHPQSNPLPIILVWALLSLAGELPQNAKDGESRVQISASQDALILTADHNPSAWAPTRNRSCPIHRGVSGLVINKTATASVLRTSWSGRRIENSIPAVEAIECRNGCKLALRESMHVRIGGNGHGRSASGGVRSTENWKIKQTISIKASAL